jgi:hypothetical protein
MDSKYKKSELFKFISVDYRLAIILDQKFPNPAHKNLFKVNLIVTI